MSYMLMKTAEEPQIILVMVAFGFNQGQGMILRSAAFSSWSLEWKITHSWAVQDRSRRIYGV